MAAEGATGRAVRWLPKLAWIAILISIPWTSVWTIGQDEQGVVTRFGRVQRIATSGIHFTMPWPLEVLTRVKTTEVRTLSLGIGTGRLFSEAEDEPQWLTGDTNICELRVVTQYVVDDPGAYLFQLADFGDGRSRDQLIEIATRAELTRLVARMEIDDVLSVGKAQLQLQTKARVQDLLDEVGLGVRLLAISVAEARPPTEVIAAFNDVASAESDRERLVSEADGFRRDLLPREKSRANSMLQLARVYSDEVVSRARSAAARFEGMVEQVRARPEIARQRLWWDHVGGLLGRCRTTVYAASDGEPFVLRIVE